MTKTTGKTGTSKTSKTGSTDKTGSKRATTTVATKKATAKAKAAEPPTAPAPWDCGTLVLTPHQAVWCTNCHRNRALCCKRRWHGLACCANCTHGPGGGPPSAEADKGRAKVSVSKGL